MILKRTVITAVTAMILAWFCQADSVEGLPLHISRISANVIRIWAGDYVSSTAVSAIATKAGIVVIDTTAIPKLDQAFRKIIEKEFGRTDFKYLINTHGHADHTNGNTVYADCEIVAHESVVAMMKENFSDIPRLIEWYGGDIQRLNDEIAAGKPDANQKAVSAENLIVDTLSLEFLKSSPKPLIPGRTFREKLVLNCGDTTLELFGSGGTHTQSDIFILIPEKGILFTGDMMADKWLTDTPGCLATFAIQSGRVEDYPLLMRNWQAMIDRRDVISLYVPGHWNGELTFVGFQSRYEYVKTVLTDVKAIADSKGDFNQFVAAYRLKNRFPQLADSPGFSNRSHWMSVYYLYAIYSGKVSVIAALQTMGAGNRFAADLAKLKEAVLESKEKYFYMEADIINYAYFLLQQQKQIDDAIALFEFNVELYPASWNAYDSLAEAYHAKGEKKKALELYKKSIELNPNNDNGKKFIARIEQETE